VPRKVEGKTGDLERFAGARIVSEYAGLEAHRDLEARVTELENRIAETAFVAGAGATAIGKHVQATLEERVDQFADQVDKLAVDSKHRWEAVDKRLIAMENILGTNPGP
jgi:hypothetical protein